MCEGACAFEFSEDGFFVGEEVANKAVSVAFVHGEVSVESWAEDAGCEVVGEGDDEVFVGGGEFDETGEMSGYGI